MSKLSKKDIENIAKKVMELQNEKVQNQLKREPDTTFIALAKKYHKPIYEKFGNTGSLENAVRIVSIYSQGKRRITQLNYQEFKNATNIADKLYKYILNIKED